MHTFLPAERPTRSPTRPRCHTPSLATPIPARYSGPAATDRHIVISVRRRPRTPTTGALTALLKERRDYTEAQFEIWEKASRERMQAVCRVRERIGSGGTGDRNLRDDLNMAIAEFDKSC